MASSVSFDLSCCTSLIGNLITKPPGRPNSNGGSTPFSHWPMVLCAVGARAADISQYLGTGQTHLCLHPYALSCTATQRAGAFLLSINETLPRVPANVFGGIDFGSALAHEHPIAPPQTLAKLRNKTSLSATEQSAALILANLSPELPCHKAFAQALEKAFLDIHQGLGKGLAARIETSFQQTCQELASLGAIAPA